MKPEPVRYALKGLAAILSIAASNVLFAQSDNFDDGDDAGWNHFGLHVVGLPPAEYSFPADPFGGKAYRIFTPAPLVNDAGPARAFTFRPDIYQDFYAAVDLVAWDNTINQAFGFLFRASSIGLGETIGYVMNYDPNQQSGGRGQFQINRITGEAPDTIAAAWISLDPTHRYRFVLTGIGPVLTAKVYDYNDLTKPLATISAEDDTYPSGIVGLFNFSRVDANEQTNPDTGKADVTFDNYFVSATAPQPTLAGTAHGQAGAPQVVGRTPESGATFYPAATGSRAIEFLATTLSAAAIDQSSIRLLLNGTDVSSGLVITTNVTGGFNVGYDPLQPNKVYDASIILRSEAGLMTTNEWTFDTFDQNFFNSATVEVIEAEDYNYGDGQCDASVPPSVGGLFQDNPPVSGFIDLVRVPEGEAGYAGKYGLTEVDFFNYDTDLAPQRHEYRPCDPVGTQTGAPVYEPLGSGNYLSDFIRAKYAALNLPEYGVDRTEGGEWLNYTRAFPAGDYNVFLRVGARAAQDVLLSRLSNDATETNQIGVFHVPSTTHMGNFRFVPLVNDAGQLAVVNLSGQNTVRLTIAEPRENARQFTMHLNYFVFVPAEQTPPAGVELTGSRISSGQFVFSFLSETGKSYTVQFKNSLTDANWSDLPGKTAIPGTDSAIEVSDPTGNTARFYRVLTL